MRGSPPFHLALMLLMFAALAVPLVRLTSAKSSRDTKPSAAAAPAATALHSVPVLVRVKYAHPPKSLVIKDGDKVLIGKTNGPSPLEVSAELVIPKDGIELQVDASWPDGTPDTALTLELEPDGLDALSETRWSTGPSMSEFIPFVWK